MVVDERNSSEMDSVQKSGGSLGIMNVDRRKVPAMIMTTENKMKSLRSGGGDRLFIILKFPVIEKLKKKVTRTWWCIWLHACK